MTLVYVSEQRNFRDNLVRMVVTQKETDKRVVNWKRERKKHSMWKYHLCQRRKQKWVRALLRGSEQVCLAGLVTVYQQVMRNDLMKRNQILKHSCHNLRQLAV